MSMLQMYLFRNEVIYGRFVISELHLYFYSFQFYGPTSRPLLLQTSSCFHQFVNCPFQLFYPIIYIYAYKASKNIIIWSKSEEFFKKLINSRTWTRVHLASLSSARVQLQGLFFCPPHRASPEPSANILNRLNIILIKISSWQIVSTDYCNRAFITYDSKVI